MLLRFVCAVVGVVTIGVRKIFNSLPWEGCGWISWWQGGVYTSFQANKSVNDTPLYTLPGEGIAQSSLFFISSEHFWSKPGRSTVLAALHTAGK